jgi:hypothetical protein
MPRVVKPRSIVAEHERVPVPTSPSKAGAISGESEDATGVSTVGCHTLLVTIAVCVMRGPIVHVSDVGVTAVIEHGALQIVTD